MNLNLLAIRGSNASAFLTSVLEGIEGKIGESGYILAWGIDAKNATGLV
jgi:hypothetical protein